MMKLLLLSVALLCTSLSVAFAEETSDVFESINLIHSNNPNVCILEPDESIQKQYYEYVFKDTFDAVQNVENTMFEITGGNWHTPIYSFDYEEHADKFTSDFPQCNIFIEFEQLNDGMATTGVDSLGFASYDHSNSNHRYSYVKVFLQAQLKQADISICIGCPEEESNELEFKNVYKYMSRDTVKKIVTHEYLHALGLGHYILDRNPLNDVESLMMTTLDPWAENKDNEMKEIDKEMLIKLYTEDGFGGRDGHVRDYEVSELR